MRYLENGSVSVSPSELKDSDQCLRKYYYKYLRRLKIPKAMNPGLVVGKLLHSGIEKYLAPHNTNHNVGSIISDAMVDLQRDPYNLFDEDSFGGLPEPVLLQRLAPLLAHITENIQKDRVLGLEERLEMPLDKYHTLKGFLDIRYRGFDGRMKLSDFKFGKTAKSESDIISFWYQFVGYRMMVQHMFDEVPDIAMFTGSISFAAKPKDPFKYNIIPVTLNFDRMEKELVTKVHSLVEYIISGAEKENLIEHYPATGRSNGICSYCDFLSVCTGIEAEDKYLPQETPSEQEECKVQPE